ncbi:UNVERIFIED_CONTAM: hypothetical protein GTU68_036752 [Idotea baltica]|nr:hypothetical protein [Idotea baltica]
MLLRPESRGTIKLRSKNPFHKPIIDPNYLSDPGDQDVKTLVAGAKIGIQLGRASVFNHIGARLYTVPMPGCERYTNFESDEYLECLARHYTVTIYHPVGTAKMGPAGDPTSVVDSQLRVHGIRGLRVIDASIMPTIVSGNTNAPVIMIGEKGADLIKEFWAKKRKR